MSSELTRWAQPPDVREVIREKPDLLPIEIVPPPEVRAQMKKSRSRPNKGRKKRTDRNPPLETPPWDILHGTGYDIPPDIECLWYTPTNWRRGDQYRAWRVAVHAMWGWTCHLCKHGNARTADHLVPLSVWPNQPYDPRLARPAHGVEGCPTCKIKCNSSRGNRELAREIGNYQPPVAL